MFPSSESCAILIVHVLVACCRLFNKQVSTIITEKTINSKRQHVSIDDH